MALFAACGSRGLCAIFGPLDSGDVAFVLLSAAILYVGFLWMAMRNGSGTRGVAARAVLVPAVAILSLAIAQPSARPAVPDRNATFDVAGPSLALPHLPMGCTTFEGLRDLFVFCGKERSEIDGALARPVCANEVLRCPRRKSSALRCTPFRRTDAQPACLPAYFVLGVQKSGTTSLFFLLDSHPQSINVRKEPWFFTSGRGRDEYDREHNLLLYLRLFPSASDLRGGELTFGDGSVSTFAYNPAALHALVPHSRLMVILREPASRASSHFRYYCSESVRARSTFSSNGELENATSTECNLAHFAASVARGAQRELTDFTRCIHNPPPPAAHLTHGLAPSNNSLSNTSSFAAALLNFPSLTPPNASATRLLAALRSPVRSTTLVASCSLRKPRPDESYYWLYIKRWWAVYPKQRLLVLDHARLRDVHGTKALADAVASHLGLRPFPPALVREVSAGTARTVLRYGADPATAALLAAQYAPHNEMLGRVLATPGANAEGFASGEAFRWARG